MGANSKIEWTHHTFNPGVLGIWGKDGTRPVAAEAYWKQPERWNREAEAAGERRRVFCASLADVFENRPELREPRLRLFDLIRRTPHLDWLLLTKRPKNVKPLVFWAFERCESSYPADPTPHISRATCEVGGLNEWFRAWMSGSPPANLWLGTSVEDQTRADERVPALLAVPAAVRFLSCEPLLGPVDLSAYLPIHGTGGVEMEAWPHWVIVGGESGPGARPMHPEWARSIRDQCQAAGVAFHFKQWGDWAPSSLGGDVARASSEERVWRKGEWTGHAISPNQVAEPDTMNRVGKAAAGRLLDGRTWDEYPESA